MRTLTKDALDNIVDCFSCADGGIHFMSVTQLIEEFDKRAEDGDKAAERLIEVVYQFNRLINVTEELKPCKTF